MFAEEYSRILAGNGVNFSPENIHSLTASFVLHISNAYTLTSLLDLYTRH